MRQDFQLYKLTPVHINSIFDTHNLEWDAHSKFTIIFCTLTVKPTTNAKSKNP